jgi:hypothetical protein
MSQYVRVYYSVVDDERFTGVYDTPHLATWLRLLLLADAMWPASAYVPATERKASLVVLVKAGLVELLPGGKYRIRLGPRGAGGAGVGRREGSNGGGV